MAKKLNCIGLIGILPLILNMCDNYKEDNVKSLDSDLTLLDGGEEKECPTTTYLPIPSLKTYNVTRFKEYLFIVTPTLKDGSKVETYDSSWLSFTDQIGEAKTDEICVHYLDFATLTYQTGYDFPAYKVQFTKEGDYSLNFSHKGKHSSTLNITCNDSSSYYDEYKQKAKDVLSWGALTSGNVKEVKWETGYYGVAPGTIKYVNYSNDELDKISVFSLLDTDVMKVDTDIHSITGGSFDTYTYITETEKYAFTVSNHYLRIDGDSYYFYNEGKTLASPYKEAYKFTTYDTKASQVWRIKDEKTKSYVTDIDYIPDLEFTVYQGEEDMSAFTGNIYVIDDGFKLSDEMYIYSSEIFKYQNIFYQVVGDQKFDFYE